MTLFLHAQHSCYLRYLRTAQLNTRSAMTIHLLPSPTPDQSPPSPSND
jgi:hypothetical protein